MPLGASTQSCCEACSELTASSCHMLSMDPVYMLRPCCDCTEREEGFGVRLFLPDLEPLWWACIALWQGAGLDGTSSELQCSLGLCRPQLSSFLSFLRCQTHITVSPRLHLTSPLSFMFYTYFPQYIYFSFHFEGFFFCMTQINASISV